MLTLLDTYWSALLSGVCVTLLITGSAWLVGITLGLLLTLTSEAFGRYVDALYEIASLTASSIPVLVLLLWAHYPLQSIFSVVLDPIITTAAILSAVNAIGVWKLLSVGRRRVPEDLLEACSLCGMSKLQTFRYVKGPVALRSSLAGLLLLQVSVLHMSIFGSVISVPETLRVIQQINAIEYQPIHLYSLLALFFLVISLPAFFLARKLGAE